MNIAISSVIIILLLLPSIFFRTFIINSDSLENPLDTSIKTELGIVFLFAILQHIVAYYSILLYNLIFDTFNIDFSQFYFILKGDAEFIDTSVLNYSTLPFLLYILAQIFISILFAIFAKKQILKRYWDIRYKFFPISNEWDTLLSGRIFEYDRIEKIKRNIKELKKIEKSICNYVIENKELNKQQKRKRNKNIKAKVKVKIKHLKELQVIPDYNYVDIDVLVNSAQGDMIYKGRVYKYYLSKDNALDKIILKDAFRRKFIDRKDEENKDLEFYEFESKLFVIKYCEIKNLNVRFSFYEKSVNV